MKTTVTIIGGGLSGLLVAYRLAQKGISFKVVEANTRLGGRILSPVIEQNPVDQLPQSAIDLGPSWFWPGQSHMEALVRELGLNEFVYPQTDSGAAVIEYSDGNIEQRRGGGSMAGSYRLTGGMHHLIVRLLNAIPAEAIINNARVTRIRRNTGGMTIEASTSDTSTEINSQQIVLALPPRIVAETIEFEPALSKDYLSKLQSVPTWMAGQAKFAAVYSESFWRLNGLSGDGMSQLGPLVEIHDASPKSGGPYALFGFVGVPAAQRLNHGKDIRSAAVEQLARMFGEQARSPLSVHYKDWAFDSLTAVDLDRDGPRMRAPENQDLIAVPEHDALWAGTETAGNFAHSNGYLEGALEAGERAASLLIERFGVSSAV